MQGQRRRPKLLQIVCGAANARVGLKTALATVGAKLPGDKAIVAAKLRGVDSFGMLCSAKELGLADGSEGILELPADAPVGKDLRAYLQLDDEILELNVTPNRGDAMSVLGIAREVAALTRGRSSAGEARADRARLARRRIRRPTLPRHHGNFSGDAQAPGGLSEARQPRGPRHRQPRAVAARGCASGCAARACGPSARWSTLRNT